MVITVYLDALKNLDDICALKTAGTGSRSAATVQAGHLWVLIRHWPHRETRLRRLRAPSSFLYLANPPRLDGLHSCGVHSRVTHTRYNLLPGRRLSAELFQGVYFFVGHHLLTICRSCDEATGAHKKRPRQQAVRPFISRYHSVGGQQHEHGTPTVSYSALAFVVFPSHLLDSPYIECRLGSLYALNIQFKFQVDSEQQ